VYSLKNDSTLANMILDNIGDTGQIKRKVYQRRLPENPNKDYYYILRETGNLEPVLIEYGFIDNKNDAKKLKENITDYAEAVVKAITEYIGVEYTPPMKNNYIVKENDTLYSIAKKNNLTVDELKKINNLNSDNIYKGQLLKIISYDEPEYIDTEIYIVEKGDTLYSIAQSNNISVEDLKKLNNLKSNDLYIGNQIVIPKQSNEENIYDIYTVKSGDSLWKIANLYDINIKDLININNLSDLNLKINQELLVPKIMNNQNTYIVKKGDTLWSIAKKYNMTIEELKKLNNLETNLLSVNQELIIK